MVDAFQKLKEPMQWDAAPPTVRKEVLDGDKAFLLHSLFSPDECARMIRMSEDVGYQSIERQYNPKYRNNTRVITLSEELIARVWERVQPHVPAALTVHEASWEAVGMNEAIRWCRYTSGGVFKPHYDGLFARHTDERSFYTVNVYLNDVPAHAGGSTNFLSRRYRSEPEHDEAIRFRVQPTCGTALVFLHDTLHEGAPFTGERKYLMRSDVMYGRVGRDGAQDGAYGDEDPEAYKAAVNVLHEAETAEYNGDSGTAAKLYRRAFKMSPALARMHGQP